MKTYSQKQTEVTRRWFVVDAAKAPFGRIASVSASLIIGKAKPTISQHVDGGDFVIIINAKDLVTTGNKPDKKIYHNYSGYPSGLRSRRLADVDPKEAIRKAVRGMLPSNKLRVGRLSRLKIYDDAIHEHDAQRPTIFELKTGSIKTNGQ